jgi:pimeloyl-ACP methyl ester carboxylesterase
MTATGTTTTRVLQRPFRSEGLDCAGSLHLPERAGAAPVIIMAGGFGAIRAIILPAYLRRFVDAGYAVFDFDYRSFGDSAGSPRNRVDPKWQLQDWQAAVRHVQAMPEIDRSRIVLWGTSLSGGHVICTAAQFPDVAAVIAQHPHVNGLASVLSSVKPWAALKLGVLAWRDVIGGLFGKPYYVPVLAGPGELAAMSHADAQEGLQQISRADGVVWENRVLARCLFKMPSYSPARLAHRLEMPVLMTAGSRDRVTPEASARKAAARMRNAQFHVFDCHHFQPYYGEFLEREASLQLAFLALHVSPRHLPPDSALRERVFA